VVGVGVSTVVVYVVDVYSFLMHSDTPHAVGILSTNDQPKHRTLLDNTPH
jgi:hypothetical protein